MGGGDGLCFQRQWRPVRSPDDALSLSPCIAENRQVATGAGRANQLQERSLRKAVGGLEAEEASLTWRPFWKLQGTAPGGQLLGMLRVLW